MVILNYLTNHYVMLFELVGLLIMLKVSIHVPARIKRLTLVTIGLLILESIVYDLERWAHNLDYNLYRPILTAFIYSIYPIMLLFLTQITANRRIPKTVWIVLLVPLIISVPLYFTSQWTHLVCWFDESNHFKAGPLRYLPYFVTGFYIVICFVHNILYFKKHEPFSKLITYYISAGAALGVLAFITFDVTDDYGAMFTSALLLYYLFLYIHLTRIDPLTTLYNRQCFYQAVNDLSDKITGVVSADMNGLKAINDKEGHGEGDVALKTVAGILSGYCGSNATVYRIGGDEFIILFFGARKEEAEKSISVIRSKMSETPYSCAIGYAEKAADCDISDLLKIADRRMYEDKAASRVHPA